MSRRVLVVSPNFPPVNAADHQRIRMSLPYFAKFGWSVHVLCLDARGRAATLDPLLDRTVPSYVKVTRVPALFSSAGARVGDRGLPYRALVSLARAGAELLRAEKFDVIYFSTTMFAVLSLGPLWRRRFGVPYVVDFQDPWVSTYYADRGIRPPGGALKHGFASFLARNMEPSVVRNAGRIISVSEGYVAAFRKRYPDVDALRYTVLPFGASSADFEVVVDAAVSQTIFDKRDGKRHWGYLGVCGPVMRRALTALFEGLRAVGPLPQDLKLHFVGTSYAIGRAAVPSVEPIAKACGVGPSVEERTARIPFFEGLRFLMDCDRILIVGTDDASYTASKVYPCILARRPIFALLHESSSAAEVIRRCRAGTVVTFNEHDEPSEIAARAALVLRQIFEHDASAVESEPASTTDWDEFSRHTAVEMTKAQCRVLDEAHDAKDAR